jgi:protoporphyrinogen oxidase
MNKQIAIIGGGLAGLTAAYDLTRPSADGAPAPEVVIYERNEALGGLAAGFKGRPEWEWPLEHFYHHIFTNDDDIIGFTREIGLGDLLETYAPTTVLYFQGERYPFDTPVRLLRFPHLSLVDKLRMGMVLAYLKYNPKPPWRKFDKLLADEWLAARMGRRGYETVWRPMLQGKFGSHYGQVNLAWFWARVYKRTPKLAYYRGGFQALVDGLAERVRAQGVTIRTGARVTAIRTLPEGGYAIDAGDAADDAPFDAVLSTVSPALMSRLAPDLPADYLHQLGQLKSMGAVALTIALDRPLLRDGTYWVNVPKQEGLPFLALVEHTNMIDSAHYAGDRLLYIGDYLDPDHPYLGMSADELLAEYTPHLAKFNPDFTPDWITGAWLHKAVYAQPVPPVGYADMIPDIRTPLPGLYFASMSQVYPWDRGTNYAVEIGRRVATMMAEDMKD